MKKLFRLVLLLLSLSISSKTFAMEEQNDSQHGEATKVLEKFNEFNKTLVEKKQTSDHYNPSNKLERLMWFKKGIATADEVTTIYKIESNTEAPCHTKLFFAHKSTTKNYMDGIQFLSLITARCKKKFVYYAWSDESDEIMCYGKEYKKNGFGLDSLYDTLKAALYQVIITMLLLS